MKESPPESECIFDLIEPRPLIDVSTLIKYPEEPMRLGLEGKVFVTALVDSLGVVRKVELLKSTNHAFDSTVVSAVRAMKYTPATSNGHAVKTWRDEHFAFVMRPDTVLSQGEFWHVIVAK